MRDGKGGFNPLSNRLESDVLKLVATTALEAALKQEGVPDDVIKNCLTREEHDSEGERERRAQIIRLLIHKLIKEQQIFGERATSFIREPLDTGRQAPLELLVKCDRDNQSDTKDYFVLSIRVLNPERTVEAVNEGEQDIHLRPTVRYYPAHQEEIQQIHNVPYVMLPITPQEMNAMYSLWEDEGWGVVAKPEFQQQGKSLFEQVRRNLLALQNTLSRVQRVDEASHLRHIRDSLPSLAGPRAEVDEVSPQVGQDTEITYHVAQQTLEKMTKHQEELEQRARRKRDLKTERAEEPKIAPHDESELREINRRIDTISIEETPVRETPGSELVQEVLDNDQKRRSLKKLPSETLQDLVKIVRRWLKNRKKA